MPTNAELYAYYCRRSSCHPNSSVTKTLEESGNAPLHVLDVSGNYLGHRGLIPVLDLAKNTKTLHTLDVSNQSMGLEQVQHLAYCLAMHPCMQEVRLCNDGLHDAHADALLQLVEHNPSIAELDLRGNAFTEAAMKALKAALTRSREWRAVQLQEEETHQAYLKTRSTVQRRSYEATLTGTIPAAESGGYIHYATWWKNPQFRIQLSRSSRVSFTLECTQQAGEAAATAAAAATQIGLLVLRHDGVHKAVQIIEGVSIVAESPVRERRTIVQTYLDEADSYVVMPFTFNPGRALAFQLTATLVNERTSQAEGWITMEPIDARYDWCVRSVDTAWTAENAGGCGRCTTWRRNAMFHLTSGATLAAQRAATPPPTAPDAAGIADTASIFVLLMKEADPYVNDARAIGLDVVGHDPHNRHGPPLRYSSDVVYASLPHTHTTFVLLHLQLPLHALDAYIVPSTEEPGQIGAYSITVFSSVEVEVATSTFPHGWRYRVVEGQWDPSCCGGCRQECQSWKNNPSIDVTFESTGGPVEGTPPLIACLEYRDAAAPSGEAADGDQQQQQQPDDNEKTSAVAVVEEQEMSPEAAQRKAELTEFRQRHRSSKVEVCVMAVRPDPPTYPVMATSGLRERAAAVAVEGVEATPCDEAESQAPPLSTVSAAPPSMFIVPMLRHAAEVGAYTLELFSPEPFLASTPAVCLAVRERQAQLAAYGAESEKRRALQSLEETAQKREGGGVGGVTAAADTPALREERCDILARLSSAAGSRFTDRDFPRGTSSLFLDPSRVPPLDFPEETRWRRVTELTAHPHVLNAAGQREVTCPPYPYGPRHWFASVLHAVAAKPGWLGRLAVAYVPEAGFAQFAYYKQDTWVGVTIDDYVLVDNQDHFVCGHSAATAAHVSTTAAATASQSRTADRDDVFFPLAEKAYAKLHRCYEALEPKVCPQQTLVELLQQGLMDTTSGFSSVMRVRSADGGELPFEEREQIWRQLKRAIDSTTLCALMLESSGTQTRQRTHVGLLPDRLYGVMDARFVEQQRLVKLRNYDAACDTECVWKGKWRRSSAYWTATLRDVLQYPADEDDASDSPHAIWIHFDELLYYFTHLFVTEVCPTHVTLPGSFAESTAHDPAGTDAALRNPQFALTVKTASADAVVQLHLGLHRRDPRLDITRERNATATIKTPVGFAVLATEDNTRRVCHTITDDQLRELVKPNTNRDSYVTLQLSAEYLRTHQLTVMPMRGSLHDPDVAYTLSASCAKTSGGVASVQLTHVTANTTTVVEGRWESDVRAGGPQSPQWRNNPQFFLSAAETMEATITLRPTTTTTDLLGFTLHNTTRCTSFLTFDEDTVVARASAEVAGAAPTCVVRLSGAEVRRGMPYVLVPHRSSGEAGEDGVTFAIEVVGNRPVTVRPIDARLDWHRLRRNVSINAAAGNTGGGPSFPSWRFNTQLAVTLPVEREGRLFIAARRTRSADPRVKVGLLLLRAEAAVAGGYRRRLTYNTETDVVAQSAEGTWGSVLDTEVSLPRDHGALLLVIYADHPYKEADVELSFYSAAMVAVQPVMEWPKVLWQEGSWSLGVTAGGSRTDFASWINNPFFGLSVIRPTKVTLLLVQYPRDHEHPVVKRHGQQKALLPPPLEHPERCTSIQISIAKYDATLTEVVSTEPTTCAEVHVTVELTPELPYLVVPCTTEPQHDGDFKLFVFADHPVDFYETEKPRLPYV